MKGSKSFSDEKKYTGEEFTRMLQSAGRGNTEIVNELLPLVYEKIRELAHHKLRFERNNHTLDTTELVHETYMKLVDQKEVEWQSYTHFLAIASLAMKRILIDYARKKNALKRGKNFQKTTIEPDKIALPDNKMSDSMGREVLAVNDALKKMEQFNKRGVQVVNYHFFGGMTWKEISEVMGISPVTVRRSWYAARLWLRRELQKTKLPHIVTRK